MPDPFAEQIFLYGPPYSGKTSTGVLLAAALDLPFIDLDHEIEKQTSRLIPQIFQDSGEAGFRQHESEVLAQITQTVPAVIALGGGALLSPENRRRVEKRGQVICLNPPLESLLLRARTDAGIRPLLHEAVGQDVWEQNERLNSRLAALLEQRHTHYASFPLTIPDGSLNPAELAGLAQVRLGRFLVSGMGAPYTILVRRGLHSQVGDIFSAQGLTGPLVLVADEQVALRYAEPVSSSLREAGYLVHQINFPAGEKHKTILTASQIWQEMLAQGTERRSTLLALGGGVATDLGGFAAAAYMRGIPWVAMPTSLLGMVDASIGGKTGVDLQTGKNIVGAFHPPRLVLVDPNFLSSLPAVEFNNGMAEVIKAGVIGDAELFTLCSQGPAAVKNSLAEVIARAIAVKVKVIQSDPFEENLRAVLNFGHTLGHAIESASGYCFRHGEAVASGMVAAARLAQRRGLTQPGLVDQLKSTLEKFNLPVDLLAAFPAQPILEAMRSDKKRAAGRHRFVLPHRIGEVTYPNEIDEAEICTLF